MAGLKGLICLPMGCRSLPAVWMVLFWPGRAISIPISKRKRISGLPLKNSVEEDAFVIDVREPVEWDRGHIEGAVNIPMSQFRDRLDEIPTDRPVYCHCRIGQRSYNVVRALNQLGFPNAVNIGGSYLGSSQHEYFHDVADGRTKLVTEYNFN